MAGNSLRYECKPTDIAMFQGVCQCRTVLAGGHRAAGRLLVTDIVQRSIVCSSFDRSQANFTFWCQSFLSYLKFQ